MKKIYVTVVLALMAMLSITMGASANTNTVTMQRGVAALAVWDPTPAGGFTQLQVIQATPKGATDMTTLVDVVECDAGFVNCGFYEGTVPNSAFDMKSRGALKEADLSSVTIPLLFSFSGVPPATIDVDAHWDGVGDITKSSFESKFKSDTLITKFDSDSSRRDATATGDDSVHGSLGTSSFAELFSFRSLDHILTKP